MHCLSTRPHALLKHAKGTYGVARLPSRRTLAMNASDKSALLARSWTQIADKYDAALAPLFRPWISQLIASFAAHNLPPGPVLAPACGPGEELTLLAAALPQETEIVGVDLAEGMVAVAAQRIAAAGLRPRVSVCVGDASRVPQDLQPLAGVFSCFGLQQIPQPKQVLHNWIEALAPGGILGLCYWPPAGSQVDAAWRSLTDPSLFKPDAVSERGWDADLASSAEAAGAAVLDDSSPVHSMRFDSPAHCFEVMMEAGPLHSRLLHKGHNHMQELKQRYVAVFGTHQEGTPFVVRPNARTLLLKKKSARAAL